MTAPIARPGHPGIRAFNIGAAADRARTMEILCTLLDKYRSAGRVGAFNAIEEAIGLIEPWGDAA